MSLADESGTLVVLFNATPAEQSFAAPLPGDFALHPVQRNSADPVVRRAAFDAQTRELRVPARTTAVFTATRTDP